MRPTRSGWGTIVAAVGLYAIGVALGFPELVVAGGALLLLLVAAVVWVLRPPSLSVARQIEPSRVRRGSPALGLVRVANVGHRRSPRLTVEDRAGDRTVGLDLPPLRPGQHRSSTYRLPTSRRGVFDVGPLVLSQTDPFGLLSRSRSFGEVAQLWVHPRTHQVAAARTGSTVEMDGPMDDTAPEGTIAFQGLRPYVVGDDLRMVHWRTTARTGTLMVKKHVDTNRPQVVVLIDDRARSYGAEEAFEEAVDVAASLMEQVLRGGAPVRVDTVSGSLNDYVPRAVIDALDVLAELRLGDTGDLDRAVLGLEVESGGSAAVLVTGDRLDDDPAALDRLASRYNRVSALIIGSESAGATTRQIGRLQVCQASGAAEVLALWPT
ncbi:MAG: DUF58 domain-containing protein [Acidimicrobiaceae bacterium]|nr:DUF58 domain-containing protein [Acidimicrobiaceae bacterium]